MDFFSEILLPETKEVCRVRQFTYHDFYVLNKFITNNNDEHIWSSFTTLLQTYTNKTTFTFLDSITLLLFMRAISISPEINFNVAKKTNVVVNIMDIIQKLSNISVPEGNISFMDSIIKLKTPTKLYNYEYSDFLYSIVTDEREDILLPEQKQILFNVLPAAVLSTIIEYETKIEEVLADVKFEIQDKDFNLSIISNNAQDLVKICYTDNILNIHKKIIDISSNTHLTASYIIGLPPAEVYMLIADINETKQQEQNKQNNLKSPNIGFPL